MIARVTGGRLILQRALAVLAAVCLVAALALGTTIPPDEPLSEVLAAMDADTLPRLQRLELHRLGMWAWRDITVPLLERPIWLLPFAVGVLCLGGVASLNWMRQAGPYRRRG